MAISASDARSRLFPLIQQVNDDHAPVRITSRSGDAVLMSAEDYDSWQETIYLLRSPANAQRLMEAIARDKESRPAITKTMEELEALAGEVCGYPDAVSAVARCDLVARARQALSSRCCNTVPTASWHHERPAPRR